MRLKLARILFVAVGLMLIGIVGIDHAAAEVEKVEKPTGGDKPKKKTSIDFEDELVEGEVKKPELFYLLQKKQFNFKRLIKLRENFLPEMRRDGYTIRRGRSKN